MQWLPQGAGPSEVRRNLNAALRVAQEKVLLVTPYVVPGEFGMDRLRIVRTRGIKVSILTDLLESTDEPVVHTGYRRYRKEMLRAGAELFELNPQRTRRRPLTSIPGNIVLRIDTTSAIVDRSVVFIGSLKFDQGLSNLTTEIGLLIDSPELARDVLQLVDAPKYSDAYQLLLGADSGFDWVVPNVYGGEVSYAEPPSSWWRRFMLAVMSLLVPESVL